MQEYQQTLFGQQLQARTAPTVRHQCVLIVRSNTALNRHPHNRLGWQSCAWHSWCFEWKTRNARRTSANSSSSVWIFTWSATTSTGWRYVFVRKNRFMENWPCPMGLRKSTENELASTSMNQLKSKANPLTPATAKIAATCACACSWHTGPTVRRKGGMCVMARGKHQKAPRKLHEKSRRGTTSSRAHSHLDNTWEWISMCSWLNFKVQISPTCHNEMFGDAIRCPQNARGSVGMQRRTLAEWCHLVTNDSLATCRLLQLLGTTTDMDLEIPNALNHKIRRVPSWVPSIDGSWRADSVSRLL